MIDFTKFASFQNQKPINPRDIFMSLNPRNSKYQYPRDVQGEVWKQWFEKRASKDIIIKMNTGSGKTVVALMILQSCLNEGVGPAVYVVPDNYLVRQVKAQASELGIKIVDDAEDLDFQRKKAIFVTNINKIVNGKSIFGLRDSNNYNIGSMIIDDVHACVEKIQQQFTVRIEAEDPIYAEIIKIFSDTMNEQSEERFSDIVERRTRSDSMLVPFWSWQDQNAKVYKLLSEHSEEDALKFTWALIKDDLKLSHCYISSKAISIIPNCTPMYKLGGFVNANRRIYMSATLPDDSSFVTVMGTNIQEIDNAITPEKANDIGERLIIVPKAINKDMNEEEIINALIQKSEKYNVVVIVPSFPKSKRWEERGGIVLYSENIDEGVEQIKARTNGLYIIVNRYDGIDLPDDACRILVIDGLPSIRDMDDKYEYNVAGNSERIQRELIQRIEQGMGRGVRSYNDYCLIVLLGNQLTNVLFLDDGKKYFSNATRAQFELSEKIWEQVENENIDKIMELGDAVLKRDRGWVSLCKQSTSEMAYDKKLNISKTARILRGAFDKACSGDYRATKGVMEELVIGETNERVKGYYKQLLAEYVNLYDKSEAQKILKSAKKINRNVLSPIGGIQYDKDFKLTSSQAKNIIDNIEQNHLDANGIVLYVDSILDDLKFEDDSAARFEKAIRDIFTVIGFEGKQPEKESGKGPDDFIKLGEGDYFVIECKNETTAETVCKRDCNQLNGSYQWFMNIYSDNVRKCVPVMIHNSNVFNYECSPNEKTRIMTPDMLEKFKKNVRSFVQTMCLSENFKDMEKTNILIKEYKLNKEVLVNEYTKMYRVKNQ